MYKLKVVVLGAGILLSACTGSKKLSSVNIKKDEVAISYASTITAKELKEHLYVIASDKYMGRETGKIGQQMTEKYLINSFKEDGVAPGNNGKYTQFFDLIELMPPSATIKKGKNEFYFGKNFFFYPSYSDFKPFELPTTDFIDLSYGISNDTRDDYKNKNVKNKVVLIQNDNPVGIKGKGTSWRDKLTQAQKQGAKAVFFIEPNFDARVEMVKHFIETPSMKLKDDKVVTRSNYIPFYFISPTMYQILFMDDDTDNKTITHTINQYKNELRSSNVLGFIEGTDEKLKKEIVVITAHYDHIGVAGDEIFNGADDDGTGTVALLELAEAFQKAKNAGNGTKRSILIMPVSGEEKGLLGSSYYTSNPVYPLTNTVVDLNIDMIGRLDSAHLDNPNYVYLIGADKISKELHNISEGVNKTYSGIELDYTFNKDSDPNRFYYRSDHYNFAKNGIPVIFYFNGVHADYHKSTDTVEKIDFDKMENITRLVFYTAWEVANRKDRLKID